MIALGVIFGILLLLVAGGFALATYQANYARTLEAQVALTAQRSAAASNAGLVIVLVLVIVALVALIVGYLYLRWKFSSMGRRSTSRALGRRVDRGVISRAEYESLIGGSSRTERMMEQMIELKMLDMLDDRQARQRYGERAITGGDSWSGR